MNQVDSLRIAQEIFHLVPLLARRLQLRLRESEFQLAPGHMPLLKMMQHSGALPLHTLAKQHMVSSPTMSNTITALEERGWVQRIRSEADRRVVFIDLTPLGREVIAQIDSLALAEIQGMIEGLNEADRLKLWEGLQVLDQMFLSARHEAADDCCPSCD